MKSQEIYTVTQRVYVRYVVQRHAKRGDVLFYFRAAILQIGFIFVYKEEIENIS